MTDFIPKLFMVFDVESIGIHGEGFAVGWIVCDRKGHEFAHGCAACDPLKADGDYLSREWVDKNVPVPQSGYNRKYPSQVRSTFWEAWVRAKEQGAVLAAECAWPVEARFLNDCVEDAPVSRSGNGPYPLHEISMYLIAAGMDPMIGYPRSETELPIHDPLADARQSARLLVEAINRINDLGVDDVRDHTLS